MKTFLKPLAEIVETLIQEAGTPSGISGGAKARFYAIAETAECRLLNTLLELPEGGQPERFVRMQVQQLVELDDRLATTMGAMSAPFVDVLRAMARRLTVSLPAIDPATLPVPVGVTLERHATRTVRMEAIAMQLREEGVEEALVQTVLTGPSDTRVPQTDYEDRLLDELEAYRFIPLAKRKAAKAETATTQLAQLLIQFGFNPVRFHRYCFAGILGKLADARSKEGRLAILDGAARTIHALKPLGVERYAPELEPIDAALLAWIGEESERVRLDDTLVDTEAEYRRIRLNLNVHEKAILAKLFYDEGVIDEENLDTYARKLTFHFSSKEREVVSETSLRAKMTTKDDYVYLSVKKLLEKMVARMERML